MRELPILFSGAMVRAILGGRKTQTRRIVKPQPADPLANHAEWLAMQCPYGQAGDRLYVRETWAQPTTLDPGPTFYRADYPDNVLGKYENLPPAAAITWKPSIHMPRALSRILLEITAVHVQRLDDCSQEDAEAEGVQCDMSPLTFCDHFHALWDLINGPGAWAANPWVWVVEFKRI